MTDTYDDDTYGTVYTGRTKKKKLWSFSISTVSNVTLKRPYFQLAYVEEFNI